MLVAIKHQFACDKWEFKCLILDDKLNAYIDINQFSRRLVTSSCKCISHILAFFF